MLIQFFKNNNPASYILLPLITILLWIPGFLSDQNIILEQGMPLYDIIIGPLDNLHFITMFIAVSLVCSGAFILNSLVNDNEILPYPTFLPALLYVIILSSIKSSLALHPILFANIFTMFSIQQLTSSYRKNNAFSNVFNAGILLSIATLFYAPYMVLFPLLGVGIQIFRPIIWREWVIGFMGVVFPYLFVLTYYFWTDMIEYFWYNKIYYSFFVKMPIDKMNMSHIFVVVVGAFIGIVSVAKIVTGLNSTSQKTRKGIILFIWLLVFSLLTGISTGNSPNLFFWLTSTSISVFAAIFFFTTPKTITRRATHFNIFNRHY